VKQVYFNLRDKLFINRLTHFVPGMVKPFVLCYHQINEKEFEEQVVALLKKFQIVDVDTFIQKLKDGSEESFCAITLDDCLKKDIRKVIPICQKYDVPITCFLPVKFSIEGRALPGTKVQRFLEERKRFVLQDAIYEVSPKNRTQLVDFVHAVFNPARLTIATFEQRVGEFFNENNVSEEQIIHDEDTVISADQVRKLSKLPFVNFQSHTYGHETLSLCSKEEVEFELKESKRVLAEITGRAVNAVCYPYGSKETIGKDVSAIVRKYYDYGFTLVQGVCNRKSDIHFIPRIGIYPGDSLSSFWGKIYHYMQIAFLK
jgi:peptidoglycan/xylan/chitin deacetylase (PgdA/CDA1 family)